MPEDTTQIACLRAGAGHCVQQRRHLDAAHGLPHGPGRGRARTPRSRAAEALAASLLAEILHDTQILGAAVEAGIGTRVACGCLCPDCGP
jgi:hypothetical protein